VTTVPQYGTQAILQFPFAEEQGLMEEKSNVENELFLKFKSGFFLDFQLAQPPF
jgi:hypothetical protein